MRLTARMLSKEADSLNAQKSWYDNHCRFRKAIVVTGSNTIQGGRNIGRKASSLSTIDSLIRKGIIGIDQQFSQAVANVRTSLLTYLRIHPVLFIRYYSLLPVMPVVEELDAWSGNPVSAPWIGHGGATWMVRPHHTLCSTQISATLAPKLVPTSEPPLVVVRNIGTKSSTKPISGRMRLQSGVHIHIESCTILRIAG